MQSSRLSDVDILISIINFIMDMTSRGIVINDPGKLMEHCELRVDAGDESAPDILTHLMRTGRKLNIHFYADAKVIIDLKKGEYDFYLKAVYGFTDYQVSVFINAVEIMH